MRIEGVILFIVKASLAVTYSLGLVVSQVVWQVGLKVEQNIAQDGSVMEDRIGNICNDAEMYLHQAHRHYLG
jgi:hypothetical protein